MAIRVTEDDGSRWVTEEAFNELVTALRLILPLAKGYAAEHPVGSNALYVATAESVLDEEEAC